LQRMEVAEQELREFDAWVSRLEEEARA
jgi:hypothetical protein